MVTMKKSAMDARAKASAEVRRENAATLRTVSENAAARKRRASVKAGMAQRMAAPHTNASLPTAEERIANLILTNDRLRDDLHNADIALRREQVERRKLTEEVTAIASSLGRCGDGELVISRMLFGAVRFHGSSSPTVADAPEPAPETGEVWMAYRAKTEG